MKNDLDDTLFHLHNWVWRKPRRDIDALVAHLEQQPRFADLTRDELATLVRIGTTVSIPAHWAFMQQGVPADDLYLLLTGDAEVFNRRQHVGSVRAGDIVGELALLRGGQRTATVTSGAALRALRVDYDRMSEAMQRHRGLRDLVAGIGEEHSRSAA
jgi:CRP/FNR family cyclic AMP-dependent transcriptional regulator